MHSRRWLPTTTKAKKKVEQICKSRKLSPIVEVPAGLGDALLDAVPLELLGVPVGPQLVSGERRTKPVSSREKLQSDRTVLLGFYCKGKIYHSRHVM